MAESERSLAAAGARRCRCDPRRRPSHRGVFTRPIFSARGGSRFPELPLSENMYRHRKVITVRRHADRIVRELFAHFMADPQGMPAEWGAGT